MRRYVAFPAVIAVCVACQARGELITNGGFETSAFDGWTQWGDLSGTSVAGSPHSGSYAAWFGPTSNFGGIRQTLAVSPDQTVSLSFWLANGGGPVNAFEVKLDGVTLISRAGRPSFGYTEFTFEHVVTNANPVLEFSFFHIPAHFRLDDVSAMVIAPLPPASYAGFIGLALAGVITRRRRVPSPPLSVEKAHRLGR